MRTNFTKRGIVSFLTLATITFLALSSSNNPPNGRTGAPGDGLCSDCHSQNNPPQDGALSISGLPSTIEPNMTYTLTVTVSNPNGLAQRAGFQMVVLDSEDENTGTLEEPSSSSVVTSSGGRDYHEHNPSKNFGSDTEVSWTVDWTAPTGPDMETVTAYAAGIVGNGSGSSGDLLVTSTRSGNLSGSSITLEMLSEPVSCFEGSDGSASVNVEGGTPAYTYFWSTGQTSQSITGLPAGDYSVTVTDAQLSSAVASVEVSQPTAVLADIPGILPPACAGDANGQLTAQGSGGTPNYTYVWSDGSLGATVTNLPEGTYTVTITDANGCSAQESATLTDPDPIVVELLASVDPPCSGEASGFIEVGGTGGTPPFTYIWSNGATGPIAEDLIAGVYSVTVSDLNGCSLEETYVLVDPTGIEVDEVIITDVSCNGGSDGSISVSATGQGLTYQWSNGGEDNQLSGLAAGTYTLTVTDAGGCSIEESYTVSEPASIVLIFNGDTSVSCFGDEDATVTSSATGGTPPYVYTWPDGEDGTGLGGGTYVVTVTDATACTSTGVLVINEPDALFANLTSTDVSAQGASDGMAESTPGGGVPPYDFEWSTGEVALSGLADTISDLEPGDYSLTITDANGCTTEQTVTVNAFGCTLEVDVTTTDISCFGLADGMASLSWSGANGDISISWSTGDTSSAIVGLGPGGYSVTISDTSGCIAQQNIMISEPPELTFELQYDSLVCQDEIVDVAVTPIDLDQYIWSDGQIGQVVSLLPGDYCVTVVDQNGCSSDTCFSIQASPPMEIVVDSLKQIESGSAGFANITVEGGSAPLFYEWYTNGMLFSTEEDIEVTQSGEYVVIVTDAVGCSVTGDTLVFDEVVGVENVARDISLGLMPNPARDRLILTTSGDVTINAVMIYSAEGSLVRRIENTQSRSLTIGVGTYAPGLYYVGVITDRGSAASKFVKQ